MYGREVRAPIDLVFGTPAEESHIPMTTDEFVDSKIAMMQDAYRTVREHLECYAEREKHSYDLRVRPAKFKPGDWVWLYTPRRFLQRSPKWQKCYTGPYLVVQVLGPVNLMLQRSARSKRTVVHVDKVKLFKGDAPQAWLANLEEAVEVESDSDEGPVVDLPIEPCPSPVVEPFRRNRKSAESNPIEDGETKAFGEASGTV